MAETLMRKLWKDPAFLELIEKSSAGGSRRRAGPRSKAGPVRELTPSASAPDAWEIKAITVSTQNLTIVAGTTQRFTATSVDHGGQPQDETEAVEWSTSDLEMLSFDDLSKK